MKFMNDILQKNNKGTWIRKVSMFLCVVLLTMTSMLEVYAQSHNMAYENTVSTNAVSQIKKDDFGDTPESCFVGETRYDFCEIEYSVLENGNTEEFPAAYMSLEGVSDNSILYDPYVSAPSTLTAVRDQKSTSTCWAFAMMGAMELSAIRKELRTNEQFFSPYHFAYFQYHHVPDPLGGTVNDRNYAQNSFLNDGGNLYMALFNAANWIGGADESVAPFETSLASNYIPSDELCYEGENVLLNAHMISTDNTEGKMVQDIKKAVMDYGGVAIMYNASASYVNHTTGASYCPVTGTNHSVIIVGWDDNYSVTNFNSSYAPLNPGAWIIKNSYGAERGREGYYYLSYEDKSIAYPVAVDVEERGAYQNNYHYDGALAATDASVAVIKSGGAVSNIFYGNASPIGTDESLKAVQIALQSVDVSYKLSIYKDLSTDENGNVNPSEGTLMHTQEGVTTRAGIYTIPLTGEVLIGAGDSFSIVFELYKDDGSNIRIWAEKDYNYTWCYGTASIQKNQSFKKSTKSAGWSDLSRKLSSAGETDEVLKNNEALWNESSCLVRIKAFTDTLDTVSSNDIADFRCSVSENNLIADGTEKCPLVSVQKGKEILVKDRDYTVTYEDNIYSGTGKAIVTGLEPYYGSVTIPFRIYACQVHDCTGHEFDENNTCSFCGYMCKEQQLNVAESFTKTYKDAPFSLNVTGNKGVLSFQSDNRDAVTVDGNGMVTIHNTGTANILITAQATDEYKETKVTVSIHVLPLAISSVTLSQTSFYYDGESKFPREFVRATDGEILTAYKDYTVQFTNNVNVGTAFVVVKGIGNYEGSLLTTFTIEKRPQQGCNHIYQNGICKYCEYVKTLQILTGTESYEKKYSDGGFYLDMITNGDGKLTYSSDDTDVVKVDAKGYVTLCGTGSAYITVTAEESNNYFPSSRQVLVEVTQGKTTIRVPKTSITKSYKAKDFKLDVKTNSNGKVTYKTSDKKVATVSAKGKVKIKGYGKATITVTSAETELFKKRTKKITIKVVPKKAALSKVKAKGNKQVTVKIKKNSSVSGYQIKYSKDKNFKKNVMSKALTSPSKNRCTIKGLKKNTTYYFKVRSYKQIGKTKYYGAYSTVKKVKVK